MENKKRLIEIPEDGIIRIPIMAGETAVGEKCIDLSHIPTVDAVEVMHGRWIHDGQKLRGGVDWWHCSECGRPASGVDIKFNYCPNCGAKMDGDENG